MSDQHTPGRIYFRANGDANSYALMDQATNNWRMTILLNGEQVTAQQAADLERMAACWNACEVISTDTLERGPDSVFIYAGDLTKQRDELLQALRDAKANAGNPEAVYLITRAAIAKTTGSTT